MCTDNYAKKIKNTHTHSAVQIHKQTQRKWIRFEFGFPFLCRFYWLMWFRLVHGRRASCMHFCCCHPLCALSVEGYGDGYNTTSRRNKNESPRIRAVRCHDPSRIANSHKHIYIYTMSQNHYASNCIVWTCETRRNREHTNRFFRRAYYAAQGRCSMDSADRVALGVIALWISHRNEESEGL